MKFFKSKYSNERLALIAKIKGEYEVVSVNLTMNQCPEGYCYLNTNNYPNIAKAIKKSGLGMDTKIRGYSGFCRYPLFKINVEKLKEAQ